jgi:hypothetical protein
MCAIIWYVQLVHYPAFHDVDRKNFSRFHTLHARRTTILVLVPMLIELLASGYELLRGPGLYSSSLASLTLGTWLLTFFVSVPLHDRLAKGYDEARVRSLVRSNWWRTAAWSAKAVLMLVRPN